MEILINFPGGARVDARVRDHIVQTDQPKSGGGDDSAPSPFELFLASLGTCAGIYVLGFCRQRNLPAEGIRIVQRVHADTSELEIQVPPAFPKQYLDALIRSAELCKVKKTLENPPQFKITARELEAE